MKAPYYEILKDEKFDEVSELIFRDKQPIHFVRRRNRFYDGQTALPVSDDEARGMFDYSRAKNLRTLNMNFYGWAKYLILFQSLFLISFGIILYWIFGGVLKNPNAETGTIILFIFVCCILGIVSGYLTYDYISKYLFLKKAFYKLDDLYVLFDIDGKPCSIEIRGKRVRILYRQTLYVLNKCKIKTIKDPLTIYCSYLNMFPQSALDIDKFVPDHSPALSEKELRAYHPITAGTYKCGECFSLSLTTRGVASKYWRIYKYIYDLDEENNLKTIYSAATESRRFRYYYITKSEIVGRGDIVKEELNNILNRNSDLKNLLENLYNFQ